MADTSYATVNELKADIQKTKDTDDAALQRILNAAAQTVDNYCRQGEGKPSGARDFFLADTTASACTFAGSGQAYQRIPDCVSVTLVEVKDSITDSDYTSWAATDWNLASGSLRHPDFNREPYDLLLTDPNGDYSVFTSGIYLGLSGFPPSGSVMRPVPTVQITAKWGYATTVPDGIAAATIMQAARWYKRLQGAMADTLASAEIGRLLFTSKIDPDVALILREGGYWRPVI